MTGLSAQLSKVTFRPTPNAALLPRKHKNTKTTKTFGSKKRNSKSAHPLNPFPHTPFTHSLIPVEWSHRESNPDLEFRKLLFYPLNYETGSMRIKKPAFGGKVRKICLGFNRRIGPDNRIRIAVAQVVGVDHKVLLFHVLKDHLLQVADV